MRGRIKYILIQYINFISPFKTFLTVIIITKHIQQCPHKTKSCNCRGTREELLCKNLQRHANMMLHSIIFIVVKFPYSQ